LEKLPENLTKEIIAEIRNRRGLPPEIPDAKKFIDEA